MDNQGEIILIRYGEIGLKGKNRSFFEQALMRNIRGALAGTKGLKIFREHGRVYVRHEDSSKKVQHLLGKVFGIVSFSPAIAAPLDLDAIKEKALEEAVGAGCGPGTTFKIETRRSNKSFPLQSPEVSRLVGAYVFVIFQAYLWMCILLRWWSMWK